MDSDSLSWQQSHLIPNWVEAIIVVAILITALIVTRRKNYSIVHGWSPRSQRLRKTASDIYEVKDDHDRDSDSESESGIVNDVPTRHRNLFGRWTVHTPSTAAFSAHHHSRVLTKFPFLVEVAYWLLTFLFYRLTCALARLWYGGAEAVWDAAQRHGVAVLELEAAVTTTSFGCHHRQQEVESGPARWIEWQIQQFFLAGNVRSFVLAVMSRAYSLVYVPVSVAFLALYYWYAPTFGRFAAVRRTLSLLHVFAFLVFVVFPTMPPRLLPPEFGFVDTVYGEDGFGSASTSRNNAAALSAMPSLHFAYAFCIGCVLVFESGFLSAIGVLPRGADAVDPTRHVALRCFFFAFGLVYPLWILLAIVATANHYFFDAFVSVVVVVVSALANRVLLNLLPLEDVLLWLWRVDKPKPTTGWRRQQAEGDL